ncbi:MAG: RNA polymerase sigma factor [Bacteroidota bacterium]
MVVDASVIEKKIVEGCIANDRLCQKELYDRYKDAMFTLCIRILKDEDLAADALQEGFIDVFSSIKTYKFLSTLGAWIKIIIVRKAILHSKRLLLHEELNEHHENETIEWSESLTGKDLAKAIYSLPQGYRSVFVLNEIEGYSHKETSDLLNIAEGTSRSQLHHAKKLLQKFLKDYRQ